MKGYKLRALKAAVDCVLAVRPDQPRTSQQFFGHGQLFTQNPRARNMRNHRNIDVRCPVVIRTTDIPTQTPIHRPPVHSWTYGSGTLNLKPKQPRRVCDARTTTEEEREDE